MQTMETGQADSNASKNSGDVVDPVLEVQNVTRQLSLAGKPLPILRGISFTIPRRAWFAIMGPSGSGKSTLLGLLAGLDTPTSGQVIVDQLDISHMAEGQLAQVRNAKIGIVFQSYNLIPTLTALENVEVPLFVSHKRGRTDAAARQLLARVGLGDRLHHRPQQLSGGEQQRVAIARALITQPAILIADEPTGNLDRTTGEAILQLFRDLQQELGITLVIATHDPVIAAQADGVLHIVDGRLVENRLKERRA